MKANCTTCFWAKRGGFAASHEEPAERWYDCYIQSTRTALDEGEVASMTTCDGYISLPEPEPELVCGPGTHDGMIVALSAGAAQAGW
jgi:hypothetical protein